ncbi:hypothetical protein [Chryseobacterium takakiae]|uniref:Uncharacterized protein n=1 Tax=Chryseobacterium takakiae TaxID=1302685 RepID=A0A1M4V9Q6_9FLAO|nr:hypothetical protein [Chryseobacterium takakiae]SHE65736.1 hypothetical protein SAMN05444408_1032 [Chryseobacterium takakiae]
MENKMYIPKNYFSISIVEKVMKEFSWPAEYILEEDADGVSIIFPKSEIYIENGYENDVSFTLLSFNGRDCNIDESTALEKIVQDYGKKANVFKELGLNNDTSVYASPEATEANIWDTIKIIHVYFQDFITGKEKRLNSLL